MRSIVTVSLFNIVFQTCLLAFSQRFLRSYLSFHTYSSRVSRQGTQTPFTMLVPLGAYVLRFCNIFFKVNSFYSFSVVKVSVSLNKSLSSLLTAAAHPQVVSLQILHHISLQILHHPDCRCALLSLCKKFDCLLLEDEKNVRLPACQRRCQKIWKQRRGSRKLT
jgi:hypothetical protein